MKYIIILCFVAMILTGGENIIEKETKVEHNFPYIEPAWDITAKEAEEIANTYSDEVTVKDEYVGYFVPNSDKLEDAGQLWEIYYAFKYGNLTGIDMKVKINNLSSKGFVLIQDEIIKYLTEKHGEYTGTVTENERGDKQYEIEWEDDIQTIELKSYGSGQKTDNNQSYHAVIYIFYTKK